MAYKQVNMAPIVHKPVLFIQEYDIRTNIKENNLCGILRLIIKWVHSITQVVTRIAHRVVDGIGTPDRRANVKICEKL